MNTKYPISQLTVGDIVSSDSYGVFTIDKIVGVFGINMRVIAHDPNGKIFQVNLNTAGSVDVWE